MSEKKKIYVRPSNSDKACEHDVTEEVEVYTTYATYDGIDTCVIRGHACANCGLLLDGGLMEDVAAETKLIDLLG
jgi:hypothetical protein